MEIMNKITMSNIAGGEIKGLLGDKEAIEFAIIIGFAQAEVKGDRPTQYGDNIWIEGNIKAKNILNKREFQSAKLYPPPLMHDLISAQIKTAGPNPNVQFAFVVGVKKSKAAIGYEYTLRSLIEPKEETNPFALIEQQIKGALPAPEDTSHA